MRFVRAGSAMAAAACLAALSSCGAESPEERQERIAEALRDVPGYDTLDDLVAELRTFQTAEDELALLDLVRIGGAGMSAQVTRSYLRSIVGRQIELHEALSTAFPGDIVPPSPPERAMRDFADGMDQVRIERESPVVARIIVPLPGGEERVLPAERLGRWMLRAETLCGGEPMDDVWWLQHRSRFFGRLKYTRDTIDAVRAGTFRSVAEALAHLEELMNGRMPGQGQVAPDPGT